MTIKAANKKLSA